MAKPVTQKPKRPRPSSRQPLQCFSCGSLLNAENNCTEFNPSNIDQVQTCGVNEACLLYTWKKSATETAVLRECFPKSVVLGPIDNPLRPSPDCNLKDVSEPGAGIFGTACLCETSFCNNKAELQTVTQAPIVINEVEDEPQQPSKGKMKYFCFEFFFKICLSSEESRASQKSSGNLRRQGTYQIAQSTKFK